MNSSHGTVNLLNLICDIIGMLMHVCYAHISTANRYLALVCVVNQSNILNQKKLV